MIDEYNIAIQDYMAKWLNYVASCKNSEYFKSLKPIAIGWKTEDLVEFNERAAKLRDMSDQVHFGWVNERWLATFHIKGTQLDQGMTVIKLMQRRPSSTDAVGLDHIDFYASDAAEAERMLEAEDTKWTREMNGDHCKWLSVWFGAAEAKIRSTTVLRVCADEMLDVEREMLV
jgi:hypothetical protein